jgi:hypothetical protein
MSSLSTSCDIRLDGEPSTTSCRTNQKFSVCIHVILWHLPSMRLRTQANSRSQPIPAPAHSAPRLFRSEPSRSTCIYFYRQNCVHRSPCPNFNPNSGPRKQKVTSKSTILPQMRGKQPRSNQILAASAVPSWPGTEFESRRSLQPQVREVGVTRRMINRTV